MIYLADYSGNAIHIVQTSGAAPNLAVASVESIRGAATQLAIGAGQRRTKLSVSIGTRFPPKP